MAGSSSPTSASCDSSRESERPPLARLPAEAWSTAQPFAGLPRTARLDYLRQYGMHGNLPTFRIGTDAYEIRPDIDVGDACETAAQFLKALIGTLDLLAMAPGASDTRHEAACGCALLARQAAGALAVMAAAIFPGDQTHPASNDD